MEVNTLVRHKSFGVGCVSKKLSNKVKVNFGLYDVKTCVLSSLQEIDTEKCKTIDLHELNKLAIGNSKELPVYIIVGNELRHYVGIGWVTHRVITESDLKKYPRVI
jgi:hypothetical protein